MDNLAVTYNGKKLILDGIQITKNEIYVVWTLYTGQVVTKNKNT